MKFKTIVLALITTATLAGCNVDTQAAKEAKKVAAQQSQYEKSQPVPVYNWSLERHLLTELYDLRNKQAVTHSVWRGDTSVIEGDCESIGFGIPYDSSLTNPLTATDFGKNKYDRHVVEMAEPNGIFASKNTSATWVMCVGDNGMINPVYIETKVTAYPYPVVVDYTTNTVSKAGKPTVQVSTK